MDNLEQISRNTDHRYYSRVSKIFNELLSEAYQSSKDEALLQYLDFEGINLFYERFVKQSKDADKIQLTCILGSKLAKIHPTKVLGFFQKAYDFQNAHVDTNDEKILKVAENVMMEQGLERDVPKLYTFAYSHTKNSTYAEKAYELMEKYEQDLPSFVRERVNDVDHFSLDFLQKLVSEAEKSNLSREKLILYRAIYDKTQTEEALRKWVTEAEQYKYGGDLADCFKEVPKVIPKDKAILIKAAKFAEENRDYAQALICLEKILELKEILPSTRQKALIKSAEAAAKTKQYSKAMKFYEILASEEKILKKRILYLKEAATNAEAASEWKKVIEFNKILFDSARISVEKTNYRKKIAKGESNLKLLNKKK